MSAGVAGGELDVVDSAFGSVVEVESVTDELALQDADGEVIEGDVVLDVVVHDEAVIGDDGDASLAGLVHNGVQGLAVDGGDNEKVDAVSYHVLDVVDLLVGLVVGEGEHGFVAGGLELLVKVGAVTVPALEALGRH